MNNEQLLSIEQLAASVAHEIRNPLALIKANLQLIELDDLLKVHKKRYGLIYSELDKISELLQDFMNLLKPLKYQFECTDLTQLVNEAIDLFTASLNKNCRIVSNAVSEHCTALCDRQMIKQVVINVIKNALEAIDHEKGIIKIKTFTSEGYVVISISDNGTGFENDMLQQIYTPFFTTKKNGTGVGLPLCKKIVEDHNGIFTITSINNQGTTVNISIPSQ